MTSERCDWRDFITVEKDAPKEVTAALDAYFGQFVSPNDGICPGCGETLFGKDFMDGMLFATFEWGLVHGHGHCRKCGWPAIAHHDIPDADGKTMMHLQNFGLAVHPDFVKRKKGKAS